ncbi:MAG: hypothetical protein ACN6O6_03000 [Pseudomonas sp.]|uniref:hypothetical protein n=1 Tax=Pseudomonas sp. TaxID=306 RepID=UPI003D104C3C
MTRTPSPDSPVVTQTAETTTASEPASKTATPGFAALFGAATAANAKTAGKSWQQNGVNRHEKKIGPAPNGSRRSMGKR